MLSEVLEHGRIDPWSELLGSVTRTQSARGKDWREVATVVVLPLWLASVLLESVILCML
jgi:hypothetical protein